ncbi:MAG: head-tail connector protein [Cloacibacillus sp.]
MPLTLAQVKAYLRVGDDNDDVEIQASLDAAVIYLKGKTAKTKRVVGETETAIEDDALFQTALKQMIAHWYENRDVIKIGTGVADTPHTADMIIGHIQICGDYI